MCRIGLASGPELGPTRNPGLNPGLSTGSYSGLIFLNEMVTLSQSASKLECMEQKMRVKPRLKPKPDPTQDPLLKSGGAWDFLKSKPGLSTNQNQARKDTEQFCMVLALFYVMVVIVVNAGFQLRELPLWGHDSRPAVHTPMIAKFRHN
ncbi:hypothetical protein B0H17DRAFT_1133195 [Mycena rosella]|uniref:Uncharacterized protein n=1 Tax=Mycena rosella TaxID=1033263 RepID=A0AAD7DIZ2_MYCRO|nr:hypothetical protein B0H17DRAFT_1133195 [Mycena rosella]